MQNQKVKQTKKNYNGFSTMKFIESKIFKLKFLHEILTLRYMFVSARIKIKIKYLSDK